MTVRSLDWAHNLLESSDFNCRNNSHNLQKFLEHSRASRDYKNYDDIHNNDNNIINNKIIQITVQLLSGIAHHQQFQVLPVPFPIPTFRHNTEVHLQKGCITESDRKYMVQTLTILLMTYKSKPSLSDCLIVSRSLYEKFQSLGDEGSQV